MDLAMITIYGKYALYALGAGAVFAALYYRGLLIKTFGKDFTYSIEQLVKKKNRNKVLLRIKNINGHEQYTIADSGSLIRYKVMENGQEVDKIVIYDERALKYWNGIPILEASPNDVRPIDRETGLYVNIDPEVINKIMADGVRDGKTDEDNKKLFKTVIYVLLGIAAAVIIIISVMNQGANDNLQTVIGLCADTTKTALIDGTIK